MASLSHSKSRHCKRKSKVGPAKFYFPPGIKYQTICKPPKVQQRDHFHQFFLTHSHFEFAHEDKKFQLHPSLIPVHYTICLKPDIETFEFEGCVAIHCELPKECSSITLNSAGLTTTKIYWLEETTDLRREPFELTPIPAEQRLNIIFEPPLEPKPGVLVINYKGHVNQIHSTGFYAAKYINEFGEEHCNGITKFLPAHARKCFPCFDEPCFKATFGLSFVVPRSLAVVSNMPPKVAYPHRSNKDLHVVEFETTPKMSVHLLAFAIGYFSFIEERIQPRLACRIYANNLARKNSGNFAFEMIKHLVEYFENYFGIPFPMKKFDIVVGKISRGAINANENWGLTVFSDGNILMGEDGVDPNVEFRIGVIATLAHVICKQWFGCLVTYEWWTDVWLFESMARLMEYMSMDDMEPSYDMWMRFVTGHYMKALELDALTSTHVIEVPIRQPSELKEVFDSMAYSKGAAVLRMLRMYIGPETFQEGLSQFLKEYSHRNASTEDLWTLLEEITGKPVIAMMYSWTKQLGFPLVRVISSRYEHNSRVISLHQDVFCSDSSAITGKPNSLWIIPISVAIGSDPTEVFKEVLMDRRSISFKLSRIGPMDWFKLNPGLNGFYRVKYPIEMFAQFRHAIRIKALPPLDRLGMLCDFYALAESGISSSTEVFGVLEAFEEEDNLSVWMEVDSIVHDLDLLLHTAECYHNFRSYVKSIYKHAYHKLGWNASETESYKDLTLRKIVFTRLLICGHAECQDEGRHKFDSLMLGDVVLPQLIPIIYKAGMAAGDSATFQTIVRRFRTTEDEQGRADILESLGFCKNEVILREILEFSVSENVHHEDTILVFKSLASNAIGRNVVWEFFKERYLILAHRYPAGSELISQLLQAVIECYNTEEKLIEISDFFRAHQSFPGCERVISQSLEKIHNLAAWYKREHTVISEYLIQFDV